MINRNLVSSNIPEHAVGYNSLRRNWGGNEVMGAEINKVPGSYSQFAALR